MPAKKRPTAKDATTPAAASPTTPNDRASESPTPSARRRSAEVRAVAADDAKAPAKKGASKRAAESSKPAKTDAKTGAKTGVKTGAKATASGEATSRATSDKSKRTTPSPEAITGTAPAPTATTNGTGAARPTASVAAEQSAPRVVISEASIRQQAYFLSLRRNGSGDPVADWLEAERMLRAKAQ